MANRVYLIDNDDSVLSLWLTEALLNAGNFVVLTGPTYKAADWQLRFPEHYHHFEVEDLQPHVLMAQVLSYIGELDGLLCLRQTANYQAFEFLSEAKLQSLMATNFFRVARLVRAVLPVMRLQGKGRILNVSSTDSLLAKAFSSSSVASKFALRGLLESIAREVDSFDVKISNIAVDGKHTHHLSSAELNEPVHPDYQHLLRLQKQNIETAVHSNSSEAPDIKNIISDLQALLNCNKPPMHVLFGEDAYFLLESHVTNMLDNIEYCQSLSARA